MFTMHIAVPLAAFRHETLLFYGGKKSTLGV